jgi:hypothetical protein
MRAASILLCVLACAACGDDATKGNGSSNGSPAPSGTTNLATVTCDPNAPFGAPLAITGLDDNYFAGDETLSSDELEIYYDVYTGDVSSLRVGRRASIHDSFKVEPLTFDLTVTNPVTPALSADDKTLYFAATSGDKSALFAAKRASKQGAFDKPTMVDGLGVVPESGYLAPNGAGLWLTVRDSNGSLDIYFAKANDANGSQFDPATSLPEINSAKTDTLPVPNADGTILYFGSSREDPNGTRLDVYMARRASPAVPFEPPTKIPGLDTPGDEYPSWLSPDGCRLYITKQIDKNRWGAYVSARAR